jgi:3',5'-cyclic AMP phosphodiesterase CpdA
MNEISLSRRDALLGLSAATIAAAAGTLGSTSALGAAPTAAPRRRSLRVAHLTDIHVQPELRAAEGMAACFRNVQQLAEPPELILTGGDSVMDSFEADDARTQLQWDLWTSVLKNDCSLDVRSCIGNHDVWGWSKSKSRTTGAEPNWGKRRAVEMLHLEERYYSFDRAGWRFIVLDSTQPLADGVEGYKAFLDEPQLDWLKATLRDTPPATPVLVVSHIPIMSASALFWAQHENGQYCVGDNLIHADALALKDLFAGHPNVKLCLSGHLHMFDRIDYNGVTYICNGAVSGNWWKGRHKDCNEGYLTLDLFDDGTFDHQYVEYGWKAV